MEEKNEIKLLSLVLLVKLVGCCMIFTYMRKLEHKTAIIVRQLMYVGLVHIFLVLVNKPVKLKLSSLNIVQ